MTLQVTNPERQSFTQPGPKAAIDGTQHGQAKQSLAKVSGAATKRIVPS